MERHEVNLSSRIPELSPLSLPSANPRVLFAPCLCKDGSIVLLEDIARQRLWHPIPLVLIHLR